MNRKLLLQLPLLGRGHSTNKEAGQAGSDPEHPRPKPPKKVLCNFFVFNSKFSKNNKIKVQKYHLIFQFIATSNIEIDQYFIGVETHHT